MSCGYLAQRLTISAFEPALREVNERQRTAWGGEIVIPGQSTVPTVPTCYVKAFNLEAEYGSGYSSEAVRGIFNKDRKCPMWRIYVPGFSPKDHFEQYQREEAEKARLRFTEQLEQRRQDFERDLETDRRRFEKTMLVRNWVFQVIITLFLACIALLSVQEFQKWLHDLPRIFHR